MDRPALSRLPPVCPRLEQRGLVRESVRPHELGAVLELQVPAVGVSRQELTASAATPE